MRRALELHRDSVCPAAARIEVAVERLAPGQLRLRYLVHGDARRLHLPALTTATRADELWRTTCFEAFIRPADAPAYYEFNFVPSTQWAAYGFSDQRTGMRVAEEVAPPQIETRSGPDGFELDARLDLDPRVFPPDRPWRLGLSAVIEDTDGGKSYWALAHPPGQPDFHHPDAFALDLPASESP
jgi:hypothetical protein